MKNNDPDTQMDYQDSQQVAGDPGDQNLTEAQVEQEIEQVLGDPPDADSEQNLSSDDDDQDSDDSTSDEL